MGLVLQLVETGADTRGRSIDLMEIDRPGDLRDIANLGLILPEAKQLLARVQPGLFDAAGATVLSPLRHTCDAK